MDEEYVWRVVQDQEYFRNLYPLRIRRIKDYVSESVEEQEGFGSGLYDEYPDRAWMDRTRDRILENLRADSVPEVSGNSGWSRDVVETLLYQEILERRSRRIF